MYLRPPPKIKVLEALSTIADERIRLLNDNYAEVTSSDGSRKYIVYVDLEHNEVCSTDNGTMLRGYIGYPIIAMLMLKGRLPVNKVIANALKGINWRELNEKYKKYSIVEEHIKEIVSKRGVNPQLVDMFKERVYVLVKKLKFKLNPEKCGEELR